MAELFLERQASEKDCDSVCMAEWARLPLHRNEPGVLAAHFCAERTARIKTVARSDVPKHCIAAVSKVEGRTPRAACIRNIAGLVREVFGNPFLIPPPSCDPAWRSWQDATPVKLARGAYEDRAFDRLPVLSDALEEAGCTDANILSHLRSPGPHVRGCWALDLVLCKS